MDRTEKQAFVASMASVFANTSMVVVTRNAGLTVADVTDLRRRMRAAGATYKVGKNRLVTLAAKGTPFEGITPMLTGPTALAWAEDPVHNWLGLFLHLPHVLLVYYKLLLVNWHGFLVLMRTKVMCKRLNKI